MVDSGAVLERTCELELSTSPKRLSAVYVSGLSFFIS